MLPNDKIHLHLADAFGVEGGNPDFGGDEVLDLDSATPPGCCNLHNALWAAYQLAKGDPKPSTGVLLQQAVKDFLSEVPQEKKPEAGHAMALTLTQELPAKMLTPSEGQRFAMALGDAVARAVGRQDMRPGEGVTMAIVRTATELVVLKDGEKVAAIPRDIAFALAAAVVADVATGGNVELKAHFEALTRSMMGQAKPLKD